MPEFMKVCRQYAYVVKNKNNKQNLEEKSKEEPMW